MTRYTPQWLQAGTYAASADRRLLGALWPAAASSGCAVTVQAGMTVNVAAGQVAVPSQNNTGSTLCTSDAVETVTLAAAPGAGTNRYDLIICQPRGNDLDGGANTDFIFTNVTGVAAASPTVPATPAGSVALAQIYIPGGSASVTAGNITDVRPGFLPISSPATIQRYQARAWRSAGFSLSATANTPTKIVWDTKVFDPANAYSIATGDYTCPAAGLYLARAATGLTLTAASQNNIVYIYRNGANDITATGFAVAASNVNVQNVQILQCAAGDTLAVYGQSSLASAGLRNNIVESGFSVVYLGPP